MDDINQGAWMNAQDRVWAHFQNKCPETFEGAKPRLDFIVREILQKKATAVPRVLNVGAGNGYLEESAQRQGWDIFCLDPNETTIERLIEKGIKGQVGYIEDIRFNDASFDFVVASEVLEHLSDEQRQRGIREVARVLDRGGRFIGTVPYCENLLLNQVVCPECGKVFHRWGHKKSFDTKTVHNELSPFFKKVVVKRTALVTFRERAFSGKVKSLVRLVLAKCGAAIAMPNIYFVARK